VNFNDMTDQLAPVLNGSEYPTRWSDYIGQDKAKRELIVAARSARIRKEPLGHVLIHHNQAGIGKTALAALIASEMRTTVRVASGTMHKDHARMVFSSMKDGDVLFYDEFHQVLDNGRKGAESWLLTFMQDGYIAGPLGPEIQPRVTIVAATTDKSKFTEALTGRFAYVPLLTDYSPQEAAKIAQKLAHKVLVTWDLAPLHLKDAQQIATVANHNPRAMLQLLKSLRDMAVVGELEVTDRGRYDLPTLLDFLGITPDGLDHQMQAYLRSLAAEFNGTAGARALAERIQETAKGLDHIERVLIDRGYVAKTRTGRQLTQAGIKRYRELECAA
jgi:holliday junction DNA helicase RuvB